MAVFCYFYTRQMVKQNIFGQLEIAADQLQKHVQVFLESKKKQIVDFCFDDFIRDYIFKGYTIVFRIAKMQIEVFGFVKFQEKPNT